MAPDKIAQVIRHHRSATLRTLAAALPLGALLVVLRAITFLPAGIAHFLGIAIDRGFSRLRWYREAAPTWVTLLPVLVTFPFVLVDRYISESSVTMRAIISSCLRHFTGRRIRHSLQSPSGFILYLRDFRPQDSDVFDYRPFVGAIVTAGHRDMYLFEAMNELPLPLVAIAPPLGHPATNNDVCLLRSGPSSWLGDVRAIAQFARGVLVALPLDGHLGALLSARDLQQVYTELSAFSLSGFEPRGHGVASELRLILADPLLRRKTLLANAFLDGQPSVTTKFRSLRDCGEVELSCVQEYLADGRVGTEAH